MAEIKLKIASVVIGSGEGGGSGVEPYYTDLPDKPSINGETLAGNMTSEDLGLASSEQSVPAGGTTGQVLAKKSNADNDVQWVNQESEGTDDYTDLSNKPQINSVALSGNKSASDLGLATANQGSKADTAVQPSEMADAIRAVNPFAGEIRATDAQRIQALANVSNQEAGYDSSEPPVFTGKMGYKVLGPTKTFAEQVTEPNTIYEIRDVFDLGSLHSTKTISCNSVVTPFANYPTYEFYMQDELVATPQNCYTIIPFGKVTINSAQDNRDYIANAASPFKTTASHYFASLYENDEYQIRFVRYFQLPANIVLKFNGGMLKNATLIGNNTKIEAGDEQIFSTDVVLTGYWNVQGIYITNFGAKSNNYIDSTSGFNKTFNSTSAIQAALFTGLPIIVPTGNFYIDDTIFVPKNAVIKGCGNVINKTSSSRIYTDKYIIMFDIMGRINCAGIEMNTSYVQIDNEDNKKVIAFNFDSLYPNKDSLIDAYVIGNSSTPHNLIAYKFDCDKEASHANGYVTALRLYGKIQNAHIGAWFPKGECKLNEGGLTFYRWATGIHLLFNTESAYYSHLLESGLSYTISGEHQNADVFQTSGDGERYHGMTHIEGASQILIDNNAYYWDVSESDETLSHRCALHIVNSEFSQTDAAKYEYSFPICQIIPSEKYDFIRKFKTGVIIDNNTNTGPGPKYTQLANPVSGINTSSYISDVNWDAQVLLDSVLNNSLYLYSLNVGSTRPTIKYFNEDNEEITNDIPIQLTATPLSGIITTQEITGEVTDGSYIEYSNLPYLYASTFVLQQTYNRKVFIQKVEIYDDYNETTLKATLNYVPDKDTPNNISICKVPSNINTPKIRLYLKNGTGTAATMNYCISAVTSRRAYHNFYMRTSGDIIKKGLLKLYHSSNPLSFVNTSVNPNGMAFPYVVMYKGTTTNRSSIVPSPVAGDLYFDTTLNKVVTYKNTTDGWTNLDGSLIEYNMSMFGKKVAVENVSVMPSGGLLPNKQYNFGDIESDIVFALKTTGDGVDETIMNTWYWTFRLLDSGINISFPSNLMWATGSAPTIEKDNYYEITVRNGVASYIKIGIEPAYLTFTAKQANSTVKIETYGDNPPSPVIQVSSDNGLTWGTYTLNDVLTLENVDDKVMFRGVNETFSIDASNYAKFIVTGNVECSGDVTSLLNNVGGDVALPDYCFKSLFKGQSALKNAPNLPSTILGVNTYYSAFSQTGISQSPAIPATVIPEGCCNSMFYNCSSLTQAGEISATRIEKQGCYAMYQDCSNLTTPPRLYVVEFSGLEVTRQMFSGCSKATSQHVANLNAQSTNMFSNNSLCESFTIDAVVPPTISSSTITGLKSDCVIYVPATSVDNYKEKQYWSDRALYIQAIPTT